MKPWLSNNYKKFIAIFLGLAALVGLYWYGGYSKDSHGFSVEKTTADVSFYASYVTTFAYSDPASQHTEADFTEEYTQPQTYPQIATSDIVETNKVESEAQSAPTLADKTFKCTIMIECHTLLSHMSELNKSVASMVPDNGIILAETVYEFEGECTAFDVLKAVCEKNNIPLEYSFVPTFNSCYVEGIAHIYEFDCGKLSGWMYGVNGKLSEYGSNNCMVNDGDSIFFSYTCDIGNDLR